MHLIDYFQAGGDLMWPLLLCSIVSVAVVLERTWRLRRAALIQRDIVDRVQDYIERGKVAGAISEYRESKVLLGRILSHGLEQYESTRTDIETSLFEAGNRGLQVLHNNLSILNLIAKVAPLLGLLGTVIGMILGFEVLEQDGVSKAKLAGAIRVALITTAAGLFVAIPTVVAAAYFRSRIRGLQAEFEEIFIDIINSVKKAGSPKMDEPGTVEDRPR
jgi:biopolymer transport protein ExbB